MATSIRQLYKLTLNTSERRSSMWQVPGKLGSTEVHIWFVATQITMVCINLGTSNFVEAEWLTSQDEIDK